MQTGPLSRARLRERGHAREDPRPLFDPRRGWVRQLERRVSNALARRVFPIVPGLSGLYDHQLQHRLVLSETEVELAQLAPAFDRLRILFVSDIHAGPFVSPEDTRGDFSTPACHRARRDSGGRRPRDGRLGRVRREPGRRSRSFERPWASSPCSAITIITQGIPTASET